MLFVAWLSVESVCRVHDACVRIIRFIDPVSVPWRVVVVPCSLQYLVQPEPVTGVRSKPHSSSNVKVNYYNSTEKKKIRFSEPQGSARRHWFQTITKPSRGLFASAASLLTAFTYIGMARLSLLGGWLHTKVLTHPSTNGDRRIRNSSSSSSKLMFHSTTSMHFTYKMK